MANGKKASLKSICIDTFKILFMVLGGFALLSVIFKIRWQPTYHMPYRDTVCGLDQIDATACAQGMSSGMRMIKALSDNGQASPCGVPFPTRAQIAQACSNFSQNSTQLNDCISAATNGATMQISQEFIVCQAESNYYTTLLIGIGFLAIPICIYLLYKHNDRVNTVVNNALPCLKGAVESEESQITETSFLANQTL